MIYPVAAACAGPEPGFARGPAARSHRGPGSRLTPARHVRGHCSGLFQTPAGHEPSTPGALHPPCEHQSFGITP
jgi:hypothetical protein